MDLHFEEANDFLEQLELLQFIHASNTSNEFKKNIGQFFTSKEIAIFMSSLISVEDDTYKLLDSCAGLGMLSISTILFLVNKGVKKIHLDAYEIDTDTATKLKDNLNNLKSFLNINLSFNIFIEDFLMKELSEDYDITVINPPYFKLSKDSKYRTNHNGLLKKSPNIYSSFIIKSIFRLKNKGQLIFITPRSFTNGSNFEEFRNKLTKDNCIEYIHLFNSRTAIFKNDKIQQENVIFKIRKSSLQTDISITNSDCIEQLVTKSLKNQKYSSNIILNQSSKNIIIIPKNKESMKLYLQLLKFPATFTQQGYKVSTGKIVQFRDKNISDYWQPNSIMVYNSHHISPNDLNLIEDNNSNKNKFFLMNGEYKKWLIQNQNYIFLRRISVKESRHRIALGIYFANKSYNFLAVENHLNYIYHEHRKISHLEILGLAIFLKSELVDNYFSVISGLTQINASDIRDIPIPPKEYLERIGLNYTPHPSFSN
ncbi:Eco57I restriction-modification methylase domain-containing protein [Acinetobacter gyllenbergii]|uniref:Eco57I restriction-modification methylase domain-containing protein n=1 Tax=Acinetobacter gyllenbergii TaxID=134534 RepID=UPI00241E2768|nr:N-6 DNA methylase [Acinetobacter gyllenbergii]